jgi:hypothetical protein
MHIWNKFEWKNLFEKQPLHLKQWESDKSFLVPHAGHISEIFGRSITFPLLIIFTISGSISLSLLNIESFE